MEFGVTFFPTVGPADKDGATYYDEALSVAEHADALGFQHVKIVEHYFFRYGGYSPDPVTFLAAAAARTRRIRLITGTVLPAFTHPVKLAGKLAMLDNLSHGRLEVGFGRAFLPDEFAAFGVSIDDSRALFEENVEAIRRLWTEEDVVWEGRFHKFGPVTLQPRPVQRPHPPTHVATAMSLESCESAGRAGHHLLLVPATSSVEKAQEMLGAYRAARAAAGHEGPGRVQFSYPTYVAEDGDEARRLARRDDEAYNQRMAEAVSAWGRVSSSAYPGYERILEATRTYDFDKKLEADKLLAGSPAEVRAQIERIQGWFGPDVTLSLTIHSGLLPVEVAKRSTELFARQVAPHFARPAR
ncbi:LLM class flavin-dependent oxidoreductase [Streptomyces sp. WELS2]|uniref:LLM class flavin-dependent oxidoreductase n=1 Tax=Streptomyces sp. WELS2 TaxID=2749435 RepID=UPI0015F00F92|nr:LLM class flavin-dependent oxidoreductase [Streptomyces sp. WELS2]